MFLESIVARFIKHEPEMRRIAQPTEEEVQKVLTQFSSAEQVDARISEIRDHLGEMLGEEPFSIREDGMVMVEEGNVPNFSHISGEILTFEEELGGLFVAKKRLKQNH